MKYTAKLNLNKPDLTDYVSIADLNENMDILDAAVGELKEGTAILPELETTDKTLAGGINEVKSGLTTHLADYTTFKNSKGKPNGIAELDQNGKLPDTYSGGVSATLKDKLQLEILDENFYVQYPGDIATSMVLDSSGNFVYIFLYYLASKYYIYKYDVNTRVQVARSSVSYIAQSHGVVQNATHLFVPVGTGGTTNRNQLAKINKETMVVDKIVSIGNDYGSVVYYNDLIYVSYYGGNLKAVSPIDLSTVKSGKPFDTTSGSSNTYFDITPNGRVFGFMQLYDNKKIREVDIETFVSLATSATTHILQWVSSKDDKYVYFGQQENLSPNTNYLGRLNISDGAFSQESIHRFNPKTGSINPNLSMADEKHLYLTKSSRLQKINKDTGVTLFENDFTGMRDLTKGPDGRLYFMQGNTVFRTLY